MATYNCAADLVGKVLREGDTVNFYCGQEHGVLSYCVNGNHLSFRTNNARVFQVLGLCDPCTLDGPNDYLRDNVDPSFCRAGIWPCNNLSKQTLAVRHLFALCEGKWGKPEVAEEIKVTGAFCVSDFREGDLVVLRPYKTWPSDCGISQKWLERNADGEAPLYVCTNDHSDFLPLLVSPQRRRSDPRWVPLDVVKAIVGRSPGSESSESSEAPEVPEDFRPLLDFFEDNPFGYNTPKVREFAAVLVELIGKADEGDLNGGEANEAAKLLRATKS